MGADKDPLSLVKLSDLCLRLAVHTGQDGVQEKLSCFGRMDAENFIVETNSNIFIRAVLCAEHSVQRQFIMQTILFNEMTECHNDIVGSV
jgi:hypothetical protein